MRKVYVNITFVPRNSADIDRSGERPARDYRARCSLHSGNAFSTIIRVTVSLRPITADATAFTEPAMSGY